MTTLLSWNVAGRVARLPEQIDAVARSGADVICLQEITAKTAPRWPSGLGEKGWPHVALSEPAAQPVRRRPLCVMTAARRPLETQPVPAIPWPERVLATEVDGITYVNLHSPISTSPDLAKVLTHEALHRHLVTQHLPAVLCGDLNTPRREHGDGRVWTFARTQHGKLRPERGQRWDEAELALIKGLEPYGWRDAFRELHGPDVREFSWGWARWKGGYRLDHLIVSPSIYVARVSYVHTWRTDRLSDHSALIADITERPEALAGQRLPISRRA